MSRSDLSETERVRQQSIEEWKAEYDRAGDNHNQANAPIVNLHSKKSVTPLSTFQKSARQAGIVAVRFVPDKSLLITTDRHITQELDTRIKSNIERLTGIAKPDTGETLYEYVEYRTFMNRSPYLAVVFRQIATGEIAERYFNIRLRKGKGNSFKTGVNCEFRIVGNLKRPIKGSFIKFWSKSVGQIPDGRPAHIYRYMNSKLAGVVVSCSSPDQHYGIIKLTDIKYEGRLYEIT